MSISNEDVELLERKFGRRLPSEGARVTLTVKAIAEIVQAARKDERERIANSPRAKMNESVMEILRAVSGKGSI